MQNETILNVFPSTDENSRLVVAVVQVECSMGPCECGCSDDGSSRLVLRQETYSPDVGWFVQSCVGIEPGQVAGLKMTLTGSNHPAVKPANAPSTNPQRIRASHNRKVSATDDSGNQKEAPFPAIIRFDGAVHAAG